jgi:hypothetical protein
MKCLAYDDLQINIKTSNNHEFSTQCVKLGIKNHDLSHFLYGLYQSDYDYSYITEYHEHVLLSIVAHQNGLHPTVFFLLFVPFVKSLITLNVSNFLKAMREGKRLSSSKNLSYVWLKPYLALPVEEVRRLLGINL